MTICDRAGLAIARPPHHLPTVMGIVARGDRFAIDSLSGDTAVDRLSNSPSISLSISLDCSGAGSSHRQGGGEKKWHQRPVSRAPSHAGAQPAGGKQAWPDRAPTGV
jgi:hypothetical protein